MDLMATSRSSYIALVKAMAPGTTAVIGVDEDIAPVENVIGHDLAVGMLDDLSEFIAWAASTKVCSMIILSSA
jgi:hypothetical protein